MLICSVRISLGSAARIAGVQGFLRIGGGLPARPGVKDFLTRESGCHTRVLQRVLTVTQIVVADHVSH
jgi:hypothetical protein